MKAHVPHSFFIYASQFSLRSMLIWIGYWAQYTMNHPQKPFGMFGRKEKYTVIIGGKAISNEAYLIQTWLIDMMYQLICYNHYGTKKIEKNESLHLIALYNSYADLLDREELRKDVNPILYALGFMGEQCRFQSSGMFFEEFSREKYILDDISYRLPKETTYGIDVKKEFFEEVGYNTDEFSALLLVIWVYFSQFVINVKIPNIKSVFNNPLFTTENLLKIIELYSIDVEGIRNSPLKRQVLYTKPIIKLGEEYMTTNPFLLLSLFSNSNYWVLRNKYFSLDSTDFINAFGYYFEEYVSEVLHNCLDKSCFYKIPEDNSEKRADWYIKLGGYEILVEQKSALSLLGIKQSHPNVSAMEKHILKNWGEAVRQLDSSQKYLNIDAPIKIVLVYEDYYKSKCLDQLFELDSNLVNDNKYWLVSICEFEDLLYLYKTNPTLALRIIKDKDKTEKAVIKSERDLRQFYSINGLDQNLYLRAFEIYQNQFERIYKLATEY